MFPFVNPQQRQVDCFKGTSRATKGHHRRAVIRIKIVKFLTSLRVVDEFKGGHELPLNVHASGELLADIVLGLVQAVLVGQLLLLLPLKRLVLCN